MKTLFLTVSIVITCSTPCLAQVDTHGLCSIDHTLWLTLTYNSYFGFNAGKIYICDTEQTSCTSITDASYTDLILFSFIYIPIVEEEYPGFIIGFLSPLTGIGEVVAYNYRLLYSLRAGVLKVSDNWTP